MALAIGERVAEAEIIQGLRDIQCKHHHSTLSHNTRKMPFNARSQRANPAWCKITLPLQLGQTSAAGPPRPPGTR